jgi:hypothetical protein
MKIELQKPKKNISGLVWKECAPFIENTRATLIHRPRSVVVHEISKRWKPHLVIGNWCGNGFAGRKQFTFLDAPPAGKIVCARCEDAAVDAGLPSSETLVGRHVHTGGVVAVMRCCGETK